MMRPQQLISLLPDRGGESIANPMIYTAALERATASLPAFPAVLAHSSGAQLPRPAVGCIPALAAKTGSPERDRSRYD
jgi:hypothetical protein